MNIIMAVGLYPVLLIMYFVMKHTALPKNGMAFGSKMKSEWLKDSGVDIIKTEYLQEMRICFWSLVVLPLVAFLTKHVSVQLTIWMMWLLIMIGVIYIPYVRANKKIKELKIENGWYEEPKQVRMVELKSAGKIRKIKFATFAAPIFLSISGVILAYAAGTLGLVGAEEAEGLEAFRIVVLILGIITIALYAGALWMDSWKTTVISSNSDVNLNYTRATKQVWKNFWLGAVWANTIYLIFAELALFLDFSFGSVVLWGAVLDTVVILFLAYRVAKRLMSIEKSYEKDKDLQVEGDDDANWYFGSLYYNPNDKHTMVNARLGVGTSVNFATPVGKALAVLSVVALLSIPFLCIWLMLEEFTPISLAVEDGYLKAKHFKVEYEIPLNELEDLTIVSELPGGSKVSGTAMDHMKKGTFFSREEGRYELFISTECTMFLKFEVENRVYYMSGIDDEETMEVLEEIGVTE